MRWAARPAGRLAGIPLWAVLLTFAWAGLVAAASAAMRARGLTGTVCWFRNVAGIPCPTCGGTRAVLDLLAGKPLAAFLQNPLLMTAGVIAGAWLVGKIGFAREVTLGMSRRERRAACAVLAVLFVLNWAYLIIRSR